MPITEVFWVFSSILRPGHADGGARAESRRCRRPSPFARWQYPVPGYWGAKPYTEPHFFDRPTPEPRKAAVSICCGQTPRFHRRGSGSVKKDVTEVPGMGWINQSKRAHVLAFSGQRGICLAGYILEASGPWYLFITRAKTRSTEYGNPSFSSQVSAPITSLIDFRWL